MKSTDIEVGYKYSNPTSKYGGIRVVDAFVTRLGFRRTTPPLACFIFRFLYRPQAERVQRQQIEIKKREAKQVLFERNVSFNKSKLENILSTFSLKLSNKAMGELTAYINRIPGRFTSQVANSVVEGKTFEVAVQEATEFLIKAAKNKGDILFNVKKNQKTL